MQSDTRVDATILQSAQTLSSMRAVCINMTQLAMNENVKENIQIIFMHIQKSYFTDPATMASKYPMQQFQQTQSSSKAADDE